MGAAAVDQIEAARLTQPLADWRNQAACRDIGDLMSLPGEADERAALAVCWNRCPVRDQCRADVMALPQQLDLGGVCGALTEAQRRHRRRAASYVADQARKENAQ